MDGGLVTLQVWRVRPAAVPRALWRMAVDPRRLRAAPGVRFGKLLGTAHGQRFGLRDTDLTRYAALVVWDDPVAAAGCDRTPLARAWTRIAVAGGRFDLRPLHSRGRWSGHEPFQPTAQPGEPTNPGSEPAGRLGETTGARGETADLDAGPGAGGPVLALTRARLRPARAATFWRAVAPVATALHHAPGLLSAFGIGEAPIGWQGTISVWRSAADLVEFAYRHPEHRTAIARTATEGWYAEELFARFAVLDVVGDRGVLGWTEERTVQG